MNRNPTFQGPALNRRLYVPAFGVAKRMAPGVIQVVRKFAPNGEEIRGKFMILPMAGARPRDLREIIDGPLKVQ
ncbi:MAG: hypothetical protein R6X05_01150 [Desulfobacterales bacterium]